MGFLPAAHFVKPVGASGRHMAMVGFLDIGLQGFAPKVLAHGHHGGNRYWEVELRPADDPRYFQISVPVQPGNSGGALVASGTLNGSLNFSVKARIGEVFAISFLNSSLTLRRAWLNFRFGFNHFIGKG